MHHGIVETSAVLWPAHWRLALAITVCHPFLVTLLGTSLTGILLRTDGHSIRMCCISTYDRIFMPPKLITSSIHTDIYEVSFLDD